MNEAIAIEGLEYEDEIIGMLRQIKKSQKQMAEDIAELKGILLAPAVVRLGDEDE